MRNPVVTRLAIAITLAAIAYGQNGNQNPRFDVVSLKHTGQLNDGGTVKDGQYYLRPFRGLQYTGVKLRGEMPLEYFLQFVFASTVKPWAIEAPDWLKSNEEFYQIEAIAPAGTTVDGARAMLRTALNERLGLKYHLVDRDTSVYGLVREAENLKLTRSTESEPISGTHQLAVFKRKSASLVDFAAFISSLTDHDVVDRTGLTGSYRFDVDWSKEVTETMAQFGQHGNTAVVQAGIKKFGMKLVPQKEARKILVIDRVNKEPTPN